MQSHPCHSQIKELNEDEKFYKDYYKAMASEKDLNEFLKNINREDALQRHLIIPDLFPENISYTMKDTEYFSSTDKRNVYIIRHNRFTPAFMHRHDFFEIIFVFSGKCAQNIGLKRIHFSAGDVIFISPGTYHTMEVYDDESIVFNILLRKSTFHHMFTPLMNGNDLLSKFFSEGLYHSHAIEYIVFHTDTDQLDYFQNTMLELYSEHLRYDSYSDQILIGALIMHNAKLIRDYQATMDSSYSSTHTQDPNFMVMSYIQNHLDTVTLSDVADHFGFSLSYCSKLIKSSTGQSFNNWKRTLRIRRAEHMLLNTKKQSLISVHLLDMRTLRPSFVPLNKKNI
jgi:YesN/AraC family two-component response regulator